MNTRSFEGSRQAELLCSAGPLPSFSGASSLQVPALTSSMLMEPVQQQQQLQQQFQQQSGNFLPDSFLPGQIGMQQQQQQQQPPQYPQQLPTFSNNILGMPSIPSSSSGPTLSGQQGMFQTGSPGQHESGGSDISFEPDDNFTADHNTTNSRRTNSKLRLQETKTKRNPKQQMQNKQAQQRYRCFSIPAWSANVLQAVLQQCSLTSYNLTILCI